MYYFEFIQLNNVSYGGTSVDVFSAIFLMYPCSLLVCAVVNNGLSEKRGTGRLHHIRIK